MRAFSRTTKPSAIRPKLEERDKVFANGDRYKGQWLNGAPEGQGLYVWKDGSRYEGQWKGGLKHGDGMYCWVNGAIYKGDWLNGCMHGVGTFTTTDGSCYTGSWAQDLKQGLGRKTYPNGDVYEGMWSAGKPHGPGRYVWMSGPEYDGEWVAGKMQGKGTIKWATGERYDGEWKDCQEQGIGVFTWPDGSTYEGFWHKGRKHGLGVFRAGTGTGKVKSRSLKALDSDGEAREPVTPRNIESPFNTQDNRLSDTAGVTDSISLAPAAVRHPEQPNTPVARGTPRPSRLTALGDATVLNSLVSPMDGSVLLQNGTAHAANPALNGDQGEAQSTTVPHTCTSIDASAPSSMALLQKRSASAMMAGDVPVGVPQPDAQASVVPADGGTLPREACWIREYQEGALVHEDKLTAEDEEVIFGSLQERREKLKAQGRKQKKRLKEGLAGEKIYKGHRSYDLMLNLQLGIRYSLTQLRSTAPPQGLTQASPVQQPALQFQQQVPLNDPMFAEKAVMYFPHDGSRETPPHPSEDFTFTDHCPTAFAKLRDIFKIDSTQYIASICGDQALRELSSPGKSGSVFFISHDDRFLAKTVRREEMRLLMELLPKYYRHVSTYHHTLLVKFFGLYKVKPRFGRRVRFIVMNNLFCSALPVQFKFDLKGSTLGRVSQAQQHARPCIAGPPNSSILKDLDLDVMFNLEEGWHERLLLQLHADCALLEELRVMDYSLLMGVHVRGKDGSSPMPTDKEETEDESVVAVARGSLLGPRPPSAQYTAISAAPRRSASEEVARRQASLETSRNGSTVQEDVPEGQQGLHERTASKDSDAVVEGGSASASPPAGAVRTRSSSRKALKEQSDSKTAAERLHSRLRAHFGNRVEERTIDDLMQLAGFRMLGKAQSLPGGDKKGVVRTTTQVLSQRSQSAGRTLRPTSYGDGSTDALSAALGQTTVQLGVNMAAVAVPLKAPILAPATDDSAAKAVDAARAGAYLTAGQQDMEQQPFDVVLYFGIIDILQEYNTRKRLESGLRRTIHSANEISAVNPGRYAKRFMEFMHKAFS